MGAYAHQEVPFEKLVEELRPERDLSRAPLFQVVFTLQNAPSARLKFAELELTAMGIENETAKYDLVLNMSGGVEGMRGSLEYNTDLFDRETIEGLLRHFQILLERIVGQPRARLSALDYSTKAEIEHRSLEKRKREDVKLKRFRTVKPKAVSLV